MAFLQIFQKKHFTNRLFCVSEHFSRNMVFAIEMLSEAQLRGKFISKRTLYAPLYVHL